MHLHETDQGRRWWETVELIQRTILTESSTQDPSKALECRRVILSLLIAESRNLVGHWSEILLKTSKCHGLLSILSSSNSFETRSFAFRCIIALLKSCGKVKFPFPNGQQPRASNGSWRTYSFEDDYRSCGEAILFALDKIIRRGNVDDIMLIDMYLPECVSLFPWTSDLLNRDSTASIQLTESLMTTTPVNSGIMSSLAGLAQFVPPGTIPIHLIQSCAATVSSCLEPLERRRLVQSFNLLLRKAVDRSTLVDTAITQLIEEGIIEAADPVSEQDLACFENLSFLDQIPDKLCTRVSDLLDSDITSDTTSSVLYGLGKASRRSVSNLHLSITILYDHISQIPNSVPLVQCLGDIVFSWILMQGENSYEVVEMSRLLISKLFVKQHSPTVLRTFMTGYSRIIESQTVCNKELFRSIDIAFRSFVEGVLEPVHSDILPVNERFLADVFRSVGLIESAQEYGLGGHWSGSGLIFERLLFGMTSGKTQVLVASLTSLRERGIVLGEVVSKLAQDNINSLFDRTSWDYQSAQNVSGCLHVICAALRVLRKHHPDVHKLFEIEIKEVSEIVRKSRIARYNPAIEKHIGAILASFV